MRTKGSLRLLTIVMMGLCIFYAVIAFQMPVGTKQVDPTVFTALSIVAGLGVLAGIVNALLDCLMDDSKIRKYTRQQNNVGDEEGAL